MGGRTEQTFFRRGNADGQEAHETISASLTIRVMEIKTTMRYHLTPLRMTIIQKNTHNKCWQGCGEKRTLVHCWWECKLMHHFGKHYGGFFKK